MHTLLDHDGFWENLLISFEISPNSDLYSSTCWSCCRNAMYSCWCCPVWYFCNSITHSIALQRWYNSTSSSPSSILKSFTYSDKSSFLLPSFPPPRHLSSLLGCKIYPCQVNSLSTIYMILDIFHWWWCLPSIYGPTILW